MKSTEPLRALCKPGLAANRINMHPNEGFDLGLMTTRHEVEVEGLGKAEVWLLNDCPKESFELNPGVWERYGKPARAVLSFDGAKLRIEALGL